MSKTNTKQYKEVKKDLLRIQRVEEAELSELIQYAFNNFESELNGEFIVEVYSDKMEVDYKNYGICEIYYAKIDNEDATKIDIVVKLESGELGERLATIVDVD